MVSGAPIGYRLLNVTNYTIVAVGKSALTIQFIQSQFVTGWDPTIEGEGYLDTCRGQLLTQLTRFVSQAMHDRRWGRITRYPWYCRTGRIWVCFIFSSLTLFVEPPTDVWSTTLSLDLRTWLKCLWLTSALSQSHARIIHDIRRRIPFSVFRYLADIFRGDQDILPTNSPSKRSRCCSYDPGREQVWSWVRTASQQKWWGPCEPPLGRYCSDEFCVEGRDLANLFGCQFIETSAKHRINVDEAFGDCVREIRRHNKVWSLPALSDQWVPY